MTVLKKKLGTGTVKYVKYSAARPGETLALGEFKGTKMVPAFDPTAPNVPQHTVVDDEGNELKLGSAGQLNFILKNVEPGTNIEVIYLGKEKVKTKTGRTVEANQFEVNELLNEEAA